jgi:hypothetical protein
VKLPEGKVLIPGVITHSSNIVEHPEWIAERLVRFARMVGRENVVAGADCGFSSQATYRRCIRRLSGLSSRPYATVLASRPAPCGTDWQTRPVSFSMHASKVATAPVGRAVLFCRISNRQPFAHR